MCSPPPESWPVNWVKPSEGKWFLEPSLNWNPESWCERIYSGVEVLRVFHLSSTFLVLTLTLTLPDNPPVHLLLVAVILAAVQTQLCDNRESPGTACSQAPWSSSDEEYVRLPDVCVVKSAISPGAYTQNISWDASDGEVSLVTPGKGLPQGLGTCLSSAVQHLK